MDLQQIADYIGQVESNDSAAWDGTIETIQNELAEQGQQLWYDSEQDELCVGPMATEEDEEDDA